MSSNRLPQPSLDRVSLNDSDYDAIEAAVMETARGRWFLSEYARRQRRGETETILGALDALGRIIQRQQGVAGKPNGVATSYSASARFTSCLHGGLATRSPVGEPPRALSPQPSAPLVPAPKQSLSAAASIASSTPMAGARDDVVRSCLLLDDALDYSLLGNVA